MCLLSALGGAILGILSLTFELLATRCTSYWRRFPLLNRLPVCIPLTLLGIAALPLFAMNVFPFGFTRRAVVVRNLIDAQPTRVGWS